MAKLYPTLEIINKQNVKPTEGEFMLLNFLINILDDSYEMYFQPFLNGDCPDIVIMKKGYGVVIIEVKDWRLLNYKIDTKTNWRLSNDETKILSPLKQVHKYKENLFNLHIDELFQRHIKNLNHWETVTCVLYFHNATENELINFILKDFPEEKNKKYFDDVNKIGLLGKDSLNKERINELFKKYSLNKENLYFDDVMYNSFYRYFQPPIHEIEEGIEIVYSKEQKELINSEVRPRRKIKGVAGSGKTLVLAKRSVNAHKRTGGLVLILTFNLSLKNYIHDRISEVKEKFKWNNFYITNYHHFFTTEANRYGLNIDGLDSWQNVEFFKKVKNVINKYDVLLIDEIQDYKQEWIDIITEYFIHEQTEFIVFGDEKQNIYERELDENNEPIVRKIPGNWNKSLNTSHRFTNSIGKIATKFQKNIFKEKYNHDEIKTLSTLDFTSRIIEYHYFETYSNENLFKEIYKVIEYNKIHSSDAGVLCSTISILREIDHLIKTTKHEETSTTFETFEQYVSFEKNKQMLDRIRRVKKFHFWMKTGKIKLSTIHSFKGWEIDTLFLIIENDINAVDFDKIELIYTGITRARRNLIIFNLNNIHYDAFFRNEIENVIIHK